MYENPYASSLETKILSANPMELVKLLYQAAIEAVQAARQHLTRGEIFERGRSVIKAVEILTELSGSLDHEKGGELSTRLAALYDYLQRTLLDANFRQADDGLATAEMLLKTLNEAWSAIEAPRPGGSLQLQLPAYSLAGTPSTTEGCMPRVAQQWCA
jgi:flagellar secretion chaperone FliS